MPRKFQQKDELSTMMDGVIANTSGGRTMVGSDDDLADIITFCEDPRYLNFLGQDPPLKLWPMQKIVLKLFYRGTRGNKHLQLDEEEKETLRDIARTEDLDYEEKYGGFLQVLEKYERRPIKDDCSDGTIFTTLELVMGRRSSKTLLVSIIAAYEAYKLLETPEGNPQKYYNLSNDKPIYIINVAVSEEQALDPLFVEIESRIARSPYFADKQSPASKTGVLYLLTDNDKRVNAKRLKDGISIQLDGSVVLMSGHSNSRSLRGKAAICILYDEFAHFQTSSGKSSGDEVFEALTPSTRQFGKDGKVVLLSDPEGKDGIFWKLFEMAQERAPQPDGSVKMLHDEILAIQLPTWRMNPTKEFTKEKIEREERPKNPIKYLTTWAARFMGEQGLKLFNPEKIESCIDFNWSEQKVGDPRYSYYLHLDPATTSHNYALVLCHPVTFVHAEQGHSKKRVCVDMVKFWRPDERGPVDISAVESAIIDICRRFRVQTVTFDDFQSQQTIQRLKAIGINSFCTKFVPSYITTIYGELVTLVNQGDLILFPQEQLIGEMRNIMYKIQNRNIKRFFDIKSMFPSDDCVDALAGAAYQALSQEVQARLPQSRLVNMGGR